MIILTSPHHKYKIKYLKVITLILSQRDFNKKKFENDYTHFTSPKIQKQYI